MRPVGRPKGFHVIEKSFESLEAPYFPQKPPIELSTGPLSRTTAPLFRLPVEQSRPERPEGAVRFPL